MKKVWKIYLGAGNSRLKLISSVMVVLTISMPVASDINTTNIESESRTNKIVFEIKSAGVSVKELANKGWIKTADWVKKNKKNVLIGAVTLGTIVIGGGVIYYLNKSSHTNPAPSAFSAPPDIQGANKSLHTVTDGKKMCPCHKLHLKLLSKN